MSTNIRFKRSDIPGKVPSLDSIDLGELALNTADGKLFTKQEIKGPPGVAAIQKIIEIGAAEVPNVLYVAKNGDDSNSGRTLGQSFLTLKKALSIATPGTTIFLKSGEYIEDNPLRVPARVSVVGDNLRNTTVRPKNPTKDIFWVYNGAYIFCMNFKGHIAPSAAVCFPPDGSAGEIVTSPYTQAVTSITTTGTGMRVDGAVTTGLRSMVCDAFTQYNQGGIGIHMLNRGNTQLVSIFTICCDISFMCENGGFCSVNLSNSSFGNYGLVSRGASEPLYRGVVKKSAGRQITFKNLAKRPNIGDGVLFADYNQTTCNRDNGLVVDGLAFDLLYEGTTQSTFAGLRYWARDNITTPVDQKTPTVAAIKRAQTVAKGVIAGTASTITGQVLPAALGVSAGNSTAQRFVTEGIGVVAGIVENGPTSPSLIVGPDLDAAEPEYKTLREQILDRQSQIVDQTIDFLKTNYSSLPYVKSKCARDVGLIISAVTDDIIFGTNYKTIKAALTYLSSGATSGYVIPSEQSTATREAFKFARDKLAPLVQEDAVLLARLQACFTIVDQTLANGASYITDITSYTSSNVNKLVYPSLQDTDETVANLVKNLQANKEYIKAEVNDYIKKNWPTVVAYGYNETTCQRDIGYALDAICYDILYGGNSQTLDAAKRYFNYASGLPELKASEEVPATTDAFGRVQLLSQRVVILDTIQSGQIPVPQVKNGLVETTQTQVNKLGALFSLFLKQLDTEIVATSDFIQPNGARLNDTNLENAFKILQANKAAIRTDVINYLARAYPAFDFDRVKCSRDVGYIIDSVCFDLVHGGNRQAVQAGIYYYDFNENSNVLKSVLPKQIKQTVNAYKYMKELLRDVITCNPTPNPWQGAVPQRTDLPAATGSEVVAVGNLIDIINEILQEGPNNAEDSVQRLKQPIGLTASTDVNKQRAFNLLMANRQFVQAEMLAFINQNWFTISDGDTSFARVNTATELSLGTTTTGYPTVTYQPASLKAIRDAVLAAKEEIKTETIKFMANSFFDNFSFNKPKCYRDVGLILDAILSDMVFDSNYKTITAAISYLRAYASEVIGAQKVQTIAALKAAKSITLARIVTPAAKTEISTRFDIILDILDKESGDGYTPTYPIPQRNNEEDIDRKTAVDILRENTEFIKDEIVAYIDANFTLNEFDREKCSRDTGLIIDALGYDLMFLSNFRSISAGRAYLRANANKVTGNQKLATLGAFRQLKKLAIAIVKTNTLAVNSIQSNMDIILDILEKGETAVPKYMIPFPSTGRNIEYKRARDLVQKNRDFIIDDVLAYINTPGLDILRGTVTYGVNPANGQYYTNGTFTQEVINAGDLNTMTNGDLIRISGATTGTSTIGGYTNPSTYKVADISTNSGKRTFRIVNLDGTSVITFQGIAGRTTGMRFELIKTGTYSVPTGFDIDKCRRDLNLILDAVFYDTTYGGTLESQVAAESYFVGALSQLDPTGNNADEVTATIRSYEYLRTVIKDVAQDNVWVPTVGNTTAQVSSPNGSDGSQTAAREMGVCIDLVLDILRNDSANILATQATLPELDWVDPKTLEAHEALQAARYDTQEAVTDYVNDNYVLFGYDREKCKRDVGYVIEAVRYDMLFNSNFRSIVAGRSYYRAMASTVVKDQKPATLASFQYLKTLLLDIVKAADADNPTVVESASIQRVSRSMDTILDILENGLTAEPAFLRPDPTGGTGNVFSTAARKTLRDDIETNRDAIENSLITWINGNNPNSVTYNEAACRRDVEYILDALYYDLTYGGNLETRIAAQAYYGGATDVNLALGAGEKTLTLSAYEELKNIIDGITAASITPSSTLIDVIKNYIDTGTLASATAPDISWVDIGIKAFNTKLAEISTVLKLKTLVTDFVDLNFAYNKDKCARDVGFLIDALCYDLLYGGNVETTQAAVAYFNGAVTPKSTIPKQIIQTVAAYERLKDVLSNVVQLKDVLPSSDNFSAKQRTEANLDLIIKILADGEEFAPARPYLMPLPSAVTGVTNNSSNAGYLNARNNIAANREFIKAETIDYIDAQTTSTTTLNGAIVAGDTTITVTSTTDFPTTGTIRIENELITYTGKTGTTFTGCTRGASDTTAADHATGLIVAEVFVYNKVKCERDIDFILDALLYDLTYGGNLATKIAADSYKTPAQVLPVGERANTAAAFTYMGTVIESVAQSTQVSQGQNRVVQVLGVSTSTTTAAAAAKALIDNVVVVAVNNNALPADSLPSTAWVSSTLTSVNTTLATTAFKDDVKAKVNLIFNPVTGLNKFPDINYTGSLKTNCEEDIVAVIDAVRYDMMFGSNFRSQVAGRAYYRGISGSANVLATQKDASIAVFELVKAEITDLIATSVPQQTKSGKAGNTGAGTAAADLIQVVINWVDANAGNDPAELEATTAWVDPDLVALSTTLSDSKTGANSVADIPASITTYINDRFPTLTYSVTDCQEDIRSITDAVRFDMMFGSNFRTISAARAYFRAQAAKAVGVQKTATLESFRLLKEKLTDLVKTNALALERVSASMDLLIKIVDKGEKAIPQFVLPSPTNYNSTYLATYGYARNLIETNREFIKNEVLKYITVTYPTLDFKEDKCLRDLDLILDAVYYDMTYGGNMESVIAGGAYYLGSKAQDLTTATLANVAITGTAGQLSCTAPATAFAVGDAVVITGTLTGNGSITGYATGKVYKIGAVASTTAFTLVNLDGSAIVTTAGTTTGLTFKFSPDQALTITGDDIAATLGAYTYLKDIIDNIARGQDVSQMQIVRPQVKGAPGSVAGAQTAKNLAYVIRNLINSSGTYAVAAPTFVAPSVSWVDPSLKNPNDLIELFKTSDAAEGGYTGRSSIPSKLTQWITVQQELAVVNTTSPNTSTTPGSGALTGTLVKAVGSWVLWYKTTGAPGSESPVVVNATALTVGKKYKIVTNTGSTFTAVGAANNNPGTVFTATNTTAGGTGTVHELFTYNVAKCERDVALIMDAVRYDMMFDTNFRTRTAAISYWRQQAKEALRTGVTTNSTYPQREQSRLLFLFMKELLQSIPNTRPNKNVVAAISGISAGSTAWSRIGLLMDDIIDMFDSSVTTLSQAKAKLPAKPFSLPLPAGGTNNSRDVGYRAARDLIESNREFIKAEILSWIDQQKRENRDGFVTPFNFNRTECAEDLDLILDAVYYDMTYGGNMESYTAGLAYYDGVSGVGASLPADEREATIRAYNYMGTLLFNVARSVVNKSYQLAIEQVKGTAGSMETAEKLSQLVDIVINVVKGGTKQVPPREDPAFLAGDETLAYVRAAVQEQKFELQARIADYIDAFILQYNTEKCARDVGLILDAAMYDLVLNSNFQSITAGSVYLQKAAQVVTSTQIGPQLQAIKFIRDKVIEISQKPPLVKNESAIGRITNLFDVMFDIIDKGVEVAPKVVNVPPLGAAFNQNAVNAANSIIANKEFLKEEVVAYITANYKTYDQSRCSRDVGLIIDAALYDLLLNTNYNSVKAGIAYRRATSSLVITDQLNETLGGIDFAKKKVVDLLDDASAIASITRSFELISSIIGGGSVPTVTLPAPGGSVFALPRPSGILTRAPAFKVAADDLVNGATQTTIKGAVETWILSQISNASAGSIWNGFTYTGDRKTKCEEDIGYILNAVAYDLTYGGNMESMVAGRAYYAGLSNASLTNAAEIPTTLAVYTYLADYVRERVVGLTGSSAEVSLEAQDLILQIRNLADAGENNVSATRLPDQTWADPLTQEVSAFLIDDKPRLQDVIIDYVNNIQKYTGYDASNGASGVAKPADYDQEKCRRDVGLVLDAIRYDLMFGTNFRTVTAGKSYARSFASVVNTGGAQADANKKAFVELKERVLGKKLTNVVRGAGAGTFTCTNSTTNDVTPLYLNQPVRVSGVYSTGNTVTLTGYANLLSQPKTYYIIATNGTTSFTLSDTVNGTAVAFGGTGTSGAAPLGLTFEIRPSIDPLDTVITQGLLDVLTSTANNAATPLVVGREYKIKSNATTIVPAGSFTIGGKYRITFVGSTNFVNSGAADNNLNTEFIATDIGTGTGTAEFVTDYTAVGASSNAAGTVFRATRTTIATTTLNGTFNDSATTLTLTSTTGFTTRGTVRIGTEVISYNGISGNDIQNCVRPTGAGTLTSGTTVTSLVAGSGQVETISIRESAERLFDLFLNILDDQSNVPTKQGGAGNYAYYNITPPSAGTTNSYVASILKARDQINAARQSLEDDLFTWIANEITNTNGNFDSAFGTYWTANSNAKRETCRRDVRLFLDAICYDLTFGGNLETITAAKAYYDGTALGIEKLPTIDAYKKLRELLTTVAGANSGNTGLVQTLIDDLISYIDQDPIDPKEVPADTSWVDSELYVFSDLLKEQASSVAVSVTNYINNTFPALKGNYDVAKCQRDIKLIIDAVRWDMMFNSNFRTRNATRSYYRQQVVNGNFTNGSVGSQLPATIDAFKVVKVTLDEFVKSDVVAQTRVAALMDIVINTLTNGLGSLPALSIPYGATPNSVDIGYLNARNRIEENREFIVQEMKAKVTDIIAAAPYNGTISGYTQEECIRDVRLILDAVRYDMTYGGNLESVVAGKAYYAGTVLANANANHIAVTEAAYTHLATLVESVATNTAVSTTTGYSGPTQVTANTAGSALAAAQAKALVNVVKSYVGTSSGNDVAEVRPSTSWVDNNLALIASTMLDRKAESLPLQVTDYIDVNFPTLASVYDKDKCKRDVQLVTEAVRYDMMFGTNFRSWTAGKAYYRNMTSAQVVTSSQKEATLAAFKFLKGLLVEIAGNNVTAVNRVKGAMNVVLDVLENGEITRNAYEAKIASAVDAIGAARATLLTDMGTWLDDPAGGNIVDGTSFGGNYSKEKCLRDLGYLIDAIRYDLTYGGNMETVVAGRSYYDGVVLQGGAGNTLPGDANHIAKTQAAFSELGVKIKALAAVDQYAVDPIIDQLILDVNQSIRTAPGSLVVGKSYKIVSLGTTVWNTVAGTVGVTYSVGDVIKVAATAAGTGYAVLVVGEVMSDASWVEVPLQEVSVSIRNQLTSIKTQVTNYVETNFPAIAASFNANGKCARDVELLTNAVRWDMLFNSNFRSITAGRAYYRLALNLQADALASLNEKAATIAAYTLLKDILLGIAAGNAIAQERIAFNMDIILQIIESGLGNQANPTITYPTVASATNASKAKDILLANRTFIQDEIITYINRNFNAVFYDEEKCARDVELITTAVAYDIVTNSNYQTITAARGYLRANAGQVLTDQQKHITVLAMKYLKNLLTNYVGGNATAVSRVKARMDIIIQTIYDEVDTNLPALSIPTNTVTTTATNTLETNRAGIITAVTNYLQNTYTWTGGDSWAGLGATKQAKCQRDVGFIVDALQHDLTYGGNWATVINAISYFVGTTAQLGSDPDEKAATLAAYAQLKTIIASYVPGQTTTANALIDIIIAVVTSGLTAAPAIVYPELLGSNDALEVARNILLSNVANAKVKVIRWTNDRAYFVYDVLKCERDIGLILDAVFADVATGSNVLSVQAGISYLRASASTAISAPQKWAILAGLTQAKSILSNVVSTNSAIISAIRAKLSVVIDIINDDVAPAVTLAGSSGSRTVSTINSTGSPYVSLSYEEATAKADAGGITSANRISAKTTLRTDATRKTVIKNILDSVDTTNPATSYNAAKCARDLALILDAIAHDVLHGGNLATRVAAASYYVGTSNQLGAVANEITETVTAMGLLKTQIGLLSPFSSVAAIQTEVEGLIDGIIAVINNGLGSVPAAVNPAFSTVTQVNLDARTALVNAKESSTQKILEFINSRPYLAYDATKCQRDVQIILDALRFDVMFGSNFKSIKAGQAYLRSYSKTVTQEQKQATIGALYFVKKRVSTILDADAGVDDASVISARQGMDIIIDILDRGAIATPAVSIPALTGGSNASKAVTTLTNNVAFIKAEVRAFIERNYPELDYDKIKCERDVEYIVNALSYDLAYPAASGQANSETREAGLSYWEGNSLTLGTGTTVTSTLVTSGNFVIGQKYQIANVSSGANPVTTDYTLIGASANTVGLVFTATGAGDGNGQAYLVVGVEQEKLATVGSYAFLADLVKLLLDNNYAISGQQQQVTSQGTYGGAGAETLSSAAKTLVLNIKNMVNAANLTAAQAVVAEVLPQTAGDTDVSTVLVNAQTGANSQIDLPTLTTAEINKAFINSSTGTFAYNDANNVQFFVYNQTKCSRDVGFVVDALAFDSFFGGNKETREAALQYAYKGGLVIPEATKIPTVGGFTRLVAIIDEIVDGTSITRTTGYNNALSQTTTTPSSSAFGDGVADKAQVIIDVLNGNTAPVLVEPDAIANKTADPEYLVIRELVRDSTARIAAQTITFINENYQGFGYLQDTCKRDVGLSLDAVAYDLIYGGNSRTKFAAEQYYSGGRFQIPADSKSATVACFVYLDALARKVVLNDAIVTAQNYVDQDKSNPKATAGEVTNITLLMDAFTDILTNGYISVLQLDATFNGSVDDNTYATFHQVSTITTTGHTLEWVGTGIDVDSALPYNGGVPKPENQLVSDKGGFINFTSTDEKGDFRIGPDLTIKRDSGSIVGRAFNKSLLGVITPYILALQG